MTAFLHGEPLGVGPGIATIAPDLNSLLLYIPTGYGNETVKAFVVFHPKLADSERDPIHFHFHL